MRDGIDFIVEVNFGWFYSNYAARVRAGCIRFGKNAPFMAKPGWGSDQLPQGTARPEIYIPLAYQQLRRRVPTLAPDPKDERRKTAKNRFFLERHSIFLRNAT